MEPRKIIYKIFILLIFFILAGCSPSADSQEEGIPLFPERQGFDLKRLTIFDADNNSLDFKRVDSVWMDGGTNKTSDEPRVTALADKLVTLTAQEIFTRERNKHREYKVDKDRFSHKVVLTFKDDTSFTLLIGIPAGTGPAYVRMGNRNIVYSVDKSLIRKMDLNIDSWQAPIEG